MNLKRKTSIALALALGLATAISLPVWQGKYNGAQAKGAAPTQTMMMAFNPFPPIIHATRIGIQNRASAVRVAVWQQGAVFVETRPVFVLKPGLVYSITSGRVTELASGSSMALPTDKRIYISAPDYRVWAGNRWYRGCIEILFMGSGVTSINLLDLEDYLQGVVPSEMPSSWHLEALKAQAVAARSYAWAHLGSGSKWKSEGYDLVPDVRDQAYKGLAAEAQSTNIAVRHTMGLILKDSGKVKPGFYRATVGDNEFENLNIRKKVVPQAIMERITGVKNIVGVTVRQWDPTGNAIRVSVMGTKEAKEVYGIALAKMLNFETAGILDVQDEGRNWVFTIRGPGNGARGLSQHGANSLAKNGWKFDQILQQYYQDPDGKLRLDYMDGYHAPAFQAAPKPKKKHTQGYSKNLIEGPKPESDKSDAGKSDAGKSDSNKSDSNNRSDSSRSGSDAGRDDTSFTP